MRAQFAFTLIDQALTQVGVAWEIEYQFGSQSLYFEWLEVGVRMMAGTPFIPGFGYELVERLIARELKGEGRMAFLPDGVSCTIEIPLFDVPSP